MKTKESNDSNKHLMWYI